MLRRIMRHLHLQELPECKEIVQHRHQLQHDLNNFNRTTGSLTRQSPSSRLSISAPALAKQPDQQIPSTVRSSLHSRPSGTKRESHSYHFRVILRLHVKHRPHNRTSLPRVHIHVCNVDAPRLKYGRHALEASDEVFWRLVMLKVGCSGDEVYVAEAEGGIGREETEDVVVVWIVAAGCLGAGGGHPV